MFGLFRKHCNVIQSAIFLIMAQPKSNCIFRTFRVKESFWAKKQSCITLKVGIKKWRLFLFVLVDANFLAWVYGKGLTFSEILVPNSLLLHTIVLKNRFLFSGAFCKGNVPRLTCCVANTLKFLDLNILFKN